MLTIDKLNDLPERIKREVLDYAEYLISKHKNENSNTKWADIKNRGISKGKSATDTILQNREEEKW